MAHPCKMSLLYSTSFTIASQSHDQSKFLLFDAGTWSYFALVLFVLSLYVSLVNSWTTDHLSHRVSNPSYVTVATE